MNRLFRGMVAAGCVTACLPAILVAQDDEKSARPRITLRGQPAISVAPARIIFTVNLVGGANDYEDYYCPTIEWEWGDDTISESSSDCDPYTPGTSEIRRRFSVERTFEFDGTYRVFVRLKKRDREVGTASTTVTVQPGAI